VAGEEGGDPGVDEDVVASSLDESLPQQDRQMDGTPDRPAMVGGGGQAEEIGHGTGSDQGYPEPAHQGIIGGMSGPAGVDQSGADPGPGQGGRSNIGLLRTRDWRGIHRHGRTVISTEGPGC